MKNVTLSAPEEHIEAARHRAMVRGSTLNSDFREWIATKAVTPEQRVARYKNLMRRLKHVNAGRRFSREEMNER